MIPCFLSGTLIQTVAGVVEFFHVELADHDVVLATGAPAESCYDAGNRAQFHNTRPGSIAGAVKPTFATQPTTPIRIWLSTAGRSIPPAMPSTALPSLLRR